MILAVLLAGGAAVVASTFPGVQKVFAGMFKSPTSEVIRYKAVRGKLAVVVSERGNLESAKDKVVQNEVEGNTTIIMILPEGKPVKKGEVVCELDSAALKDSLINQQITTQKAKADLENAQKTRQVAEISRDEYILGSYPQETQTIEGEIKLAESELERAADRLKWSEGMFKMDYVSESQVLADRMAKQKSDISLLNARKKMEVLKKYTMDKNVTELDANIKKALSDELAKKATLDLETTKERKFEKQIAQCTLIAPGDGMVVYVNENNGRMGAQGPSIEEGAAVRERQKIFSLPDLTHMRVNTKIHESMINRLSLGLPAKIKVDAIPNVPLEGEVSVVGTMADQSSMFSSDVKQYTTLVSINTHESSLRPGMTAQVEILVTELPDVISVPVQAVVQAQGKDFVFVMTPDGYQRREVKLGLTNQKMIEVQTGIKEGEEVAMNWSVLLTEDEKNALFNASVKGATKGKDWTKVPPPGTANLSPGLNPGGDAPNGVAAKGDPKAKAKAKGAGGRPKMFPDDPALQAKVDKIPRESMMKMRGASDEEKADIFKQAGLTEDEVKKHQDAAAAMMERFRNWRRWRLGVRWPRRGGGGPGGGGGGFGGGGPGGPGGGGFGGGGPGGGGPPNGGGIQ